MYGTKIIIKNKLQSMRVEITIFTQCDEVLKQKKNKQINNAMWNRWTILEVYLIIQIDTLSYSHTRCLGLHSQDVRYIVIIQGYGISS